MATDTVLEVVMPQMGVSVSEGTVTRWLRNIGDTVSADETLLEVSTDKVDTEVPSPGRGILREILVAEGETVAVGTVLALIGTEPLDAGDPPAPPPAPTTPSLGSLPAFAEGARGRESTETSLPDAESDAREPDEPDPVAHQFISPVVARIAAEHGIDPTTLTGSGRAGRVTKKDLLAFVEARSTAPPAGSPSAAPAPASAPLLAEPAPAEETIRAPTPAFEAAAPASDAPAPPPVVAPASVEAPSPSPPAVIRPAPEADSATREARGAEEPPGPGETIEAMSIMRRGIAEHMRRSLDTAAHVTSAIEVDMSKVATIRERIKQEFASAYGVNPTYLAFIARATVDTLRDWPWINAELRGDAILTRSYVNLGFAVALEGGKGLIVPVLKHAEGLNLLGMARGVADLAERARTKKLLPDDVQGGTFTITNPGIFGTLLGTPIISQPQSAILGTYAIVKRPWVISDDAGQDAIAIRSIMNLTLTYDHRLVDGAYGAQFLRDLAARLQSWGEADY